MADNNNDEKLKITAELDTSKLKQQAQQGMQSVVNETKKVENQSKQTSKAVDSIGQSGNKVGQSLQRAGNQGTEAIRKVGNEADKTVKKIDDIAKATQGIKLQQALGVAVNVANSEFGKAVGGDIGNTLGLSNSARGLAGGALTGALGGAAMGAALGPIGAAGGALLGAASGLIQAAEQQKEAARQLAASGENRANAILNTELKKQLAQEREEEYKRIAENPYETVSGNWYENGETKQVTAVQGAIDKLKWSMGGYEDQIKWAAEALERLNSIDTSNMSPEDIESHNAEIEKEAQAYEEYSARLDDANKRLAAFIALQSQLENLPVGPEIPEHILAQRNAEADAFVGPEIPDYIKAQRDAEEKAREEARKQDEAFEKTKDMNWKASLKEEASGYQEQIRREESFMGRVSNVKLTDSLTKMGGGSGYGVQMQGINSYVSKMSGNIANIKTVMEKCLETIQNIDNKYSPYGGQFVGENE